MISPQATPTGPAALPTLPLVVRQVSSPPDTILPSTQILVTLLQFLALLPNRPTQTAGSDVGDHCENVSKIVAQSVHRQAPRKKAETKGIVVYGIMAHSLESNELRRCFTGVAAFCEGDLLPSPSYVTVLVRKHRVIARERPAQGRWQPACSPRLSNDANWLDLGTTKSIAMLAFFLRKQCECLRIVRLRGGRLANVPAVGQQSSSSD